MLVTLAGTNLVFHGYREGIPIKEKHDVEFLNEIWQDRHNVREEELGPQDEPYLVFESEAEGVEETYKVSGEVLVKLIALDMGENR